MNGEQQAEPSGTQPNGEVEAAGEKLWEIHSADSMLRSQRNSELFRSGSCQCQSPWSSYQIAKESSKSTGGK